MIRSFCNYHYYYCYYTDCAGGGSLYTALLTAAVARRVVRHRFRCPLVRARSILRCPFSYPNKKLLGVVCSLYPHHAGGQIGQSVSEERAGCCGGWCIDISHLPSIAAGRRSAPAAKPIAYSIERIFHLPVFRCVVSTHYVWMGCGGICCPMRMWGYLSSVQLFPSLR